MSGGPDAEQQAWPSLGTSSPDNGDYWILVTPVDSGDARTKARKRHQNPIVALPTGSFPGEFSRLEAWSRRRATGRRARRGRQDACKALGGPSAGREAGNSGQKIESAGGASKAK